MSELLTLYSQQFKVFFKGMRAELPFLVGGLVAGYSFHQLAKLYVKQQMSKKPNLSPENQTRKYRRFIRLITRFRGGEIAAYTVIGLIKAALEASAVDLGATLISGVAGGLFTFLIKNPSIVYEASIAGITEAALRPVYAGVLSGIGLLTISCKDIPATVDALTSLDVSYKNAENQLNSFLDKMELMSHEDKVYFAVCLVTLLVYLYMTPGLRNRYYMVLQKLRELLGRKKISKSLYRLILRKLIRLEVPVDRIEYTSLIDDIDKTMGVMQSAPTETFHLFSNKLPVGI